MYINIICIYIHACKLLGAKASGFLCVRISVWKNVCVYIDNAILVILTVSQATTREQISCWAKHISNCDWLYIVFSTSVIHQPQCIIIFIHHSSSFIIIHHHSSSVVVIRYSILFWSPSSCFLWGHTVVYYFSRRISYLSGFRMGCSLSVLSLLKPIGSGSAERSFAFDWFNFWVPEMPGNLATNAFMDRTWFDIC